MDAFLSVTFSDSCTVRIYNLRIYDIFFTADLPRHIMFRYIHDFYDNLFDSTPLGGCFSTEEDTKSSKLAPNAYPFQIFSQRLGEEQSEGCWQSTTAYVVVGAARVIGYDLPFWVDGVNTINLRSPTSHEKGAHCRGPEKSIHQIELFESRIPCSSDIMDYGRPARTGQGDVSLFTETAFCWRR